MLKKGFILALCAFLFYQFCRVAQLYLILATQNKPNTLFIFIAAWTLNLLAIGIFGISGNVFPTNQLLPKGYYTIRNAALLQRYYRLLGVKYFRKALLFFHWGKPKNRKKFFNGTKQGISNFLFQSRQSEFGHLGGLVLTLVGSIYLLFYGHVLLFFFMNFISFIGNFYPMVLQRYHRIRIGKLGIH